MSIPPSGPGKVAVVIGGTSGIGLATARILLDMGARVTIAGRDAERGARASKELGERAHYTRMDVSHADQVAATIDDTVQRWGRLDWAVNSAALSDTPFARIADITEADWDRRLAVDLKGAWLAMKYELAAMLRTGGGSIVNVSSVNGLTAAPQAATYCVAKYGMHGLTKTAALEYAAQGIRVNAVCPGAHLTPMLEVVFDKLAPGAHDTAAAMYRARIPMNRIGDPAECGQAIAWLLSDAASYVTGAVLTVDGGMVLGTA
jgi:NAD(P)-dependent dehydrogenase (short-subunit alcohol dehydrogenase family)